MILKMNMLAICPPAYFAGHAGICLHVPLHDECDGLEIRVSLIAAAQKMWRSFDEEVVSDANASLGCYKSSTAVQMMIDAINRSNICRTVGRVFKQLPAPDNGCMPNLYVSFTKESE